MKDIETEIAEFLYETRLLRHETRIAEIGERWPHATEEQLDRAWNAYLAREMQDAERSVAELEAMRERNRTLGVEPSGLSHEEAVEELRQLRDTLIGDEESDPTVPVLPPERLN
jgi:hypothetical protein